METILVELRDAGRTPAAAQLVRNRSNRRGIETYMPLQGSPYFEEGVRKQRLVPKPAYPGCDHPKTLIDLSKSPAPVRETWHEFTPI